MPEKETLERAKKDEQEGKAPSTQAGEFVREEMHHVREGKHGARSTKQAIAIGLSKARRAGVKLAAPRKGKSSAQVRKKAQRDIRKGQASRKRKPSPARSRAISGALKREGRARTQHLAVEIGAVVVVGTMDPLVRMLVVHVRQNRARVQYAEDYVIVQIAVIDV